jgi:hypothetical protein
MSTETTTVLEQDIKAVTEAFLAGRPVSPDIEARLDKHAEEFRQRMIERNGLQELSVPFIRQERETGH